MPSAARKAKHERSTARMELRVPASTKALIQRAMAVSGRSAGELAYEGAKRVLEERERMLLSERDREAFLAAVRNPPRPSPRLKAALGRHARLSR